jgi:dihydrodipicolinate synthase/N-acetylneuraminate lyase
VISDIFLRGVIPIAVMPFGENDEIDENALSSQLDFLAEVGIKWIGFGYGSEVYTLAEQELLNVISYAVQSSKGKLDIIGNVELNSAVGGAERVKAIKETGASMAMIRPNGLLATNSQEDLINAFEQVASNTTKYRSNFDWQDTSTFIGQCSEYCFTQNRTLNACDKDN